MPYDSAYHYQQLESTEWTTFQPVIILLFWKVTNGIVEGPGGLFVLFLILYLTALWLLSRYIEGGWKLWNLASEGITSFSTAPLKIATYLGLIIALLSFIYGGILIINKLFYGNPVPGYPSLMVSVLFLGGVQLIAIGILGEYIGRIYLETKQRPRYLLKKPPKSHPDEQ